MRLDKAIVHAGHGSRREVQGWIRAGLVSAGGETIRKPDAAVDPLTQSVTLRGEDIGYAEHYHIMMHKPAGYVSSTEDPRERTVLELLDARRRRLPLFPAGRLDKDATGLLLLTTDGALAHRLLSPSRHVDKEYLVTVEGLLTPDMAARFAEGVRLVDGELCRPADLSILSSFAARVVLREGKYHQIKRMMAAMNLRVTSIHRLRMGALRLDEALEPGAWRGLTPEEVMLL